MTYTNQFPVGLQAGDTVTIDVSGTYTLPKRIRARIAVKGAKGGDGQSVRSQGSGSQTATGGQGARGGLVEGTIDLSIEIIATVGSVGSSPYYKTAISNATTTGDDGGLGGFTQLSDGNGIIATSSGGGGGRGGSITVTGTINVISRQDGAPGYGGGAVASDRLENSIATGGGGSAGNGSIVLTILSANQTPSAPSSIDYDVPLAGKLLSITIGPANDAD